MIGPNGPIKSSIEFYSKKFQQIWCVWPNEQEKSTQEKSSEVTSQGKLFKYNFILTEDKDGAVQSLAHHSETRIFII